MKKIFFTSVLIFLSIFSFSQDSFSVVTQGSGISFDIARKNALRYALGKVYGVFINSSTVVSNDDLIKDNTYEYSSGAISNVEDISTMSVGNNFSVTLKVTISKQKLAAIIKSKGKDIEYDASELVSSIKAKIINEQLAEESEINIINSLVEFAERIYPLCIDNEINASEPYLGIIYGWTINLDLNFKSNKNLDVLNQHINKTLEALDYNYVSEPKNGNYNIKVRRSHDDREDLGKATFTLNYNGDNYELRSNVSRVKLYEFVSRYAWSILSTYKVEMNAGIYTKKINIRPVIPGRNTDNKPTYSSFGDDYNTRVGNPSLGLKEYKGIGAEEYPPSNEIYIKKALEYYVAQDEVCYLQLNNFSAKYSCYIEFSDNKNASLDIISAIKGFKILK
jgi:hypothetical protein